MHLSSQEEYGLRCLLQVAHHRRAGPLSIADIAAAEGIGPEYAAKLLRLLRKGGLLASTRGAGGGYRLARPAASITAWDAIQALGSTFFSDTFCTTYPGQLPDCIHTSDCSIRVVWGAVEGALRGVLERITLADLLASEETVEIRIRPAETVAPIAARRRGSR